MAIVDIGSISVQLNRKAIKNLHISVLPPDGRVRVSAPNAMTDNAIRRAVVSRIPWIRQQQAQFVSQPRQSQREMVSGECHYLWGKAYRLQVIECSGKTEVRVIRKRICVSVPADSSIETKARAINEFYRVELKRRVAELILTWQQRLNVKLSAWVVRKMKTKWGSCNTDTKRILLNLELAKKPPECLEYILVHELVHLIERRHNERFKNYMDRLLPDWRERRDLLNNMPLAHEDWIY